MAGGGLWLCAAVLGCLAAATARRPGERGRGGHHRHQGSGEVLGGGVAAPPAGKWCSRSVLFNISGRKAHLRNRCNSVLYGKLLENSL